MRANDDNYYVMFLFEIKMGEKCNVSLAYTMIKKSFVFSQISLDSFIHSLTFCLHFRFLSFRIPFFLISAYLREKTDVVELLTVRVIADCGCWHTDEFCLLIWG